jgi:hypothetical protein
MLYDVYNSTSVDVSGINVKATVRGSQGTAVSLCLSSYSADVGGDCTVTLPRSLFTDGEVTSMQAWLQLLTTNGTVLAETVRSALTLRGKPLQNDPASRSGFLYAPYRIVYPGEIIHFSVFAHSGGQRAGGFQIKVELDGALLEYSGYELPSAWKVRACCSFGRKNSLTC